jgi:hypothetical protein
MKFILRHSAQDLGSRRDDAACARMIDLRRNLQPSD